MTSILKTFITVLNLNNESIKLSVFLKLWGKYGERKKIKLLINNNLTFLFVTTEVEKSNFYKDLNTLIDNEFNIKKIGEEIIFAS